MTEAGWHADPEGRHDYRYWDGSTWTEHVSTNGVQSQSPLGGGDAGGQQAEDQQGQSAEQQSYAEQQAQPAEQQAYPEQQAYAQQQYAPQEAYAPQQQDAYAQQYAAQQAAVAADPWQGLSGDLIDGTYSEVEGTGPQKQNDRLLRVRIDQPFMAKQGSMVAYQGNVDFAYQGGGAAKFLKKAVTGEGLSLMQVSGQGDVFLADNGKHVHILHVENGGISVSGHSVLAFSASLQWDVERVKGGSIAAGGLFNTTLRGTGWVAVTTEGSPVVLNPAEAPTFADAQALVAWSINLQTSIRSTFTAGSLIGRGSGEAFQVAFQGPGFVIVQPSEEPPPHQQA